MKVIYTRRLGLSPLLRGVCHASMYVLACVTPANCCAQARQHQPKNQATFNQKSGVFLGILEFSKTRNKNYPKP